LIWDIKEQITIISDDLNQDIITEKEAKAKLLILFGVSSRRELLIDFLDDVLMCQDEVVSIVDREKYVDGLRYIQINVC